MKKRRLLSLGGILAAAALVATACAEETGGDGGGSEDQPTSITLHWNQPVYAYNNNTSYGNNATNANAAYLMQVGFNYFNADTELIPNEDFGSYELVNDDPSEVKYAINDGVQWSDGTPVDAADMLLSWAGGSGALNTKDFTPKYNDEGIVQETKGDVVYFDGVSSSLPLTAKTPPTIGDDGSMTLHYDSKYVDWEEGFWNGAGVTVPAHVVGRLALGIDDPQEAKDAVVAAIQSNTTADLAKIANVWNTAFNYTELPDDEGLYLSYGAYLLSDFKANEFMTFEKNPDYTWGPEPKIDEITLRFIEDPQAAVQALENGELDAIYPQPTSDVLKQLEGIQGVNVQTGSESTYEHVDLVSGGAGRSKVFDDPQVREAFLKSLPRQRIVDDLIKPLNPEAEVLNSQLLLSEFEGYDQVVSENGSDAYSEVDVAGAKDLLAEAGVSNPEVCFLYDSSNPRRVNEFQLIQASAKQAGFNVTDCGDPNWSALLGTPGKYDASLFGWQSTSTGVTSADAIFRTKGGNNFNNYSNKTVDDLFTQLGQTDDPADQLDIQIEIEKELWADAYGATIFQFPITLASSDRIENMSAAPLSPVYFWNFWEWEVK